MEEQKETGEPVTETSSKEQTKTGSRNVNSYFDSIMYFNEHERKNKGASNKANQTAEKSETSELTRVEKLREFLRENPDVTPHDVSLLLTEMLAKESDKTNAEQHLVNAMEAQNRGTDQAQYQDS